jgi:hypothetical protein
MAGHTQAGRVVGTAATMDMLKPISGVGLLKLEARSIKYGKRSIQYDIVTANGCFGTNCSL